MIICQGCCFACEQGNMHISAYVLAMNLSSP